MPTLKPKPSSLREVLKTLISFPSWHALRTHFIAQHDWEVTRKSKQAQQFGNVMPWWSYSAISFIDQIVPTSAEVLELGSGYSTLWWLSRGNRIVAIEPSSDWATKIVYDAGLSADRLQMLNHDPTTADSLPALSSHVKFDVLVLDHSGDRTTATSHYLQFLADHGIVIFDNYDRAEYAEGLQILIDKGFARLDFFGLGPINAFASQTSIFFQDGALKPLGRIAEFGVIQY